MKITKQTKPCKGCPFAKENTCEKPNPGGSHPFVYLGQIHGPFWLPCHQDKNYKDKASNYDEVSQCRGAAIFRSNCDISNKFPDELLKLPKNNIVFKSESDFIKYYMEELSEEEIDYLTSEKSIKNMFIMEYNKYLSLNKK